MSNFSRWWNLRDAFRRVFRGARKGAPLEQVGTVLRELSEFCKPDVVPLRIDKNGATDMYQTGIVAGRIEVYQRVLSILNLTDAQLIRMRDAEEEGV